MDALVNCVEKFQSIPQLCMNAFETIYSRFPHYKSIYRIAAIQFKKCEYRNCSDTLFDKLFQTKRRHNTSIFEVILIFLSFKVFFLEYC